MKMFEEEELQLSSCYLTSGGVGADAGQDRAVVRHDTVDGDVARSGHAALALLKTVHGRTRLRHHSDRKGKQENTRDVAARRHGELGSSILEEAPLGALQSSGNPRDVSLLREQ